MRPVLSVASECAPLVKTGGLADVVGALPAALAATGWELRTILPAYPQVLAGLEDGAVVGEDADLFGGPARVLFGRAAGLGVYLLDAPHLFDRTGSIYLTPEGDDWADNPERFAALSFVAARIADEGADGWRPEILHAHDWQAALAPLYLQERGNRRVPTILTVHNIAFQGLVPAERAAALRLPPGGFTPDGYEYWGQISALKAGLVAADRITTVSPTYARQLMTPEFGMGLDGVIRARREVLSGILNGIDAAIWNPAADPEISRFRTPRGKVRARDALLELTGLPDGPGPLAVVVSRLTDQKGLDLLLEALPALTDRGGRLALLGTGDAELEEAWRAAAAENPHVWTRIGYDEGLSHRMIAGADAILVPSRFEPCGLTQLFGLRYGTIPVVAMTGGLADTVIGASPAALRAGVATGVQFHPITAEALAAALDQLCDLFADAELWNRMQRNAMRQPVGWDVSAAEYAVLYESLADR